MMVLNESLETAVRKPLKRNTLSFDAQDVTGMLSVRAEDVQTATPAGVVARSLASRMSLPDNVPWVLRDERNGAYLDDEKSIGEQIPSENAKVTVTPRTHLGAWR